MPTPVALGIFLTATGCLASTACEIGRPQGSGVLPESTYVQVMARLSLADSILAASDYTLPVGLARDSARHLVLRRWAVSDSELITFADRLGRDPSRLTDVWTRIRQVADSLSRARWTPTPSGAR